MTKAVIEEIRLKKQNLENDISCAVSKLIQQFGEETGVTPSDVNIMLCPMYALDGSQVRHIVTGTCVTLKIW